MNIENSLYEAFYSVNWSLAGKLALYKGAKFDYLSYDWVDNNIVYSVLPISKKKVASPYTAPQRQKIRLVAFIRKLLPDLTEKEVLAFVETVSAKLNLTDLTFSIVTGEEIRDRYLRDNYFDDDREEGNLQGSCMADADQQLNLDLYVYNPEAFQLLVLEDDDGLVHGRALLYKAYSSKRKALKKKNPVNLLGRVYSNNGIQARLFFSWAKENNYLRFDGYTFFPRGVRNQRWYVPLEHWNLNYYPYMDNSMNYICKKTGLISNKRFLRNMITAEQGYYEDSDGEYISKPDPFREGQTWIEERWVPNDSLFTDEFGNIGSKEDVRNCAICKKELLVQYSFKGHNKFYCLSHVDQLSFVNYYYYPTSECTICSKCRSPKLKNTKCTHWSHNRW